MMNGRTLVLLLVAACLINSSLAVGQSGSRRRPKRVAKKDSPMAQAIVESKKTGLPIFAVSVAKTCTSCKSLLNTMSTDEALQPTLKQFVYLQIDVTDPDFPAWNRKHPRERNATPAWHVVTSRGQEVKSGMGARTGGELNQILLISLEKAGRLPSQETLQKLTASANEADGHLQAGRVSEALSAMMPVRNEFEMFADILSMSEGGEQILQVAEKLAKHGHERIESLIEQSTTQGGWTTALAIAQARHSFGMLPGLQLELEAVEEQFKSDKASSKLYRSAQELLRAEALLIAGENPKKAKLALTRVITRHPNTEAATAAARLLTQGVAKKTTEIVATTSEEGLRKWTDISGKHSIQASLVSIEGKQVRLRRSNGKVVTVPLARLDQAAQQYLAELGKKF